MDITVAETKKVLKEVVEKYKNAIGRKINYLKELEDDRATLAYLIKNREDGVELDPDCAYKSYDEWVEQIEKEIKAGETSISRINVQEEELKAFIYYIENAPEEDA